MTKNTQPVFYWRWPYRVIPALVTLPVALFFISAWVMLLINTGKEVANNGWFSENVVGGVIGLAVMGLVAVTFVGWTIAAFRAGRFIIGECEILLPKLPVSPLAFFPRKIRVERLLGVDFEDESMQANKPPVVTFSIKLAKPISLKLCRYQDAEAVYEYLKQQLSNLASRDDFKA